MTHTRLVIFDLDGTLINTMGAFSDIAGALIQSNYGWTFEQGRKRYLETSGIPFFQQLEVLFPGDKRNIPVSAEFEKQKISAFVSQPISQKAIETLLWLRMRNLRTAISSNNFSYLVEEFVLRENVPIDLALGYREGFSKGSDHFQYLKEHFSVTEDEMMFVGDSLSDRQVAAQAGISFVARVGTFTKEEFESLEVGPPIAAIKEIYELMSLMENS